LLARLGAELLSIGMTGIRPQFCTTTWDRLNEVTKAALAPPRGMERKSRHRVESGDGFRLALVTTRKKVAARVTASG
jgi:hypothetical protein